ncbi:hypothetical protein ACHWQZ_G009997 [Mnemiopsis leidyi]
MNIWQPSKRFITRLPNVLHRSLSDGVETFPRFNPEHIRNFSIIAHVDHGKSTLADRLIEIGGVKSSLPQQLDNLQVERERGITVKAQCASLRYTYMGQEYLLNLIDTPGHADFTHEVGRSLFLSDGAILLVDATQGVQAQTVSNFYTAFENDLFVLGALNKIDMPNAKVGSCKMEMSKMFDLFDSQITEISAKTGENVEKLLPQVIELVPPPRGNPSADLVAILHDCQYLSSSGNVLLTVLIKEGTLNSRDSVCLLSSGKTFPVREIGVFQPEPLPTSNLSAGQLGYLILKVKDVEDVIIGDTICMPGSIVEPLKTIPKPKPSIFSGVFPDENTDFRSMKESLEKLVRSDTSVSIEADSNQTLGQGWNLGFLGTLHREVFAQRLAQEFGTSIIMTKPSITYRAVLDNNNEIVEFNCAKNMPKCYHVMKWEEPVVETTIIVPGDHLASVISHCMSCRGVQKENSTLGEGRFLLKFNIPLIETVDDFYSTIKKLSSGFATCDFEEAGYWETDLTQVDVLVNGDRVDGLSMIVRSDEIREVSMKTVKNIAKLLPREQYKIIIQCVIGVKVQARAEVKPYRKDVTKDLYGGDKTRAMKLLARQREGKKKLRERATVKIPRAVFRTL